MKIHKKDKFVSIDPDIQEKERICLYCIKQKHYSKLTRRPNYNEVDKDMWLYCHNCHRAFLMRETRMEGRLKSAVDVGVHEEERTIMGIDNLMPTDPLQKKIRERLKTEKDPDVRQLIKQGYDPVDVNEGEITRS